MKQLKFLGLFLTIGFTVGVFADGKVNFVAGNVTVTSGGTTKALTKGDTIKNGDTIKAGADGRASIFDTSSKKVTMIKPNVTIKYDGSGSAGKVGSIFKKNAYGTNAITSVAGVRGAVKAGASCSPTTPYIKSRSKRRADWTKYRQNQFEALLKATGNAKDTEARFLRAMANYKIYGLDQDSKIEYDLKKVLQANDANTGMKFDANRTLALLNIDKGEYEEALKIYSKLLEDKDPKAIDEFSYYIMILLNRNMGRQKEEADVWKYADEHCKSSKLVNSLK